MINNGIISFGDNNVNIINNKNIYNELKILLEHIDKSDEDYTLIKEAINAKEQNKLLELLKKLSKKALELIKELNLGILENLIVNILMKWVIIIITFFISKNAKKTYKMHEKSSKKRTFCTKSGEILCIEK